MRLVHVLALAVVALGSPAYAKDPPPWSNNPDYKRLVDDEVQQLGKLLTEALKADYRRQAIYLARRILEVKPEHERAKAVLEQWPPEDLEGTPPKDKFLKKLDGTLKKIGHAYFKFGEKLEAAGVDPEVYYPINILARSYGSEAGPLVTSMREAGELWMGTFSHHPTKKVKEIVGSAMYEMFWPLEWDDDFLRFNVLWPECRIGTFRKWRIITDAKKEDALRLFRAVDELERYMCDRMGGKVARKGEMIDVVVCMKGETYEKLVPIVLSKRQHEDALNRSAYYSRWGKLVLACWQDKDNDYINDLQLALGAVARAMARTHLANDAGGSVRGRGSFMFDGLAGAFEGLDWSDPGFTEVSVKRAWRLAVARALRDADKLMPWDEFFELDQAKARAVERVSLRIALNGKTREAKNVDPVAAQATALVVGMLKADPKRAPKRLGKLLRDLTKRDSLPAIDKAMGWKKGRAIQEAERAMDAAAP